jgi:hypothetical protein
MRKLAAVEAIPEAERRRRLAFSEATRAVERARDLVVASAATVADAPTGSLRVRLVKLRSALAEYREADRAFWALRQQR